MGYKALLLFFLILSKKHVLRFFCFPSFWYLKVIIKNWETMTGVNSSSSSTCTCGACKFLRRKCSNQCVFAPFFSYDDATSHFAAVHKVFGASNVSKLLLHLPMPIRSHAAITVAYEALERMRDPTYGCVGHIFALQQEVVSKPKILSWCVTINILVFYSYS